MSKIEKSHHRLTLRDWGVHDGGIGVFQDNYPEPDHPTLRELFEGFLDKKIDVIVHENEIIFRDDEEALGEVRIIITSDAPKIRATTYKDGYPLKVTVDKMEVVHKEECDEIFIENMVIRSSPSLDIQGEKVK